MIRTRDFLLFAIAVIFLSIGIGATLIKEMNINSGMALSAVRFISGQSDGEVISNYQIEDKTANLERLRSKVAAGEGSIISAPPAFTYYSETPVEGSSEAGEIEARYMQICPNYSNQANIISNWPQTGVIVKATEGARIAYVVNETGDETPLIQLPTDFNRQSNDSCLRGPVIGVGLDGRLVGNENLRIFAGSNETTLLGYALDGFPIYGFTDDESTLDQCGGKMTDSGYAYYLRPEENFVIGCFAGNPAKFLH